MELATSSKILSSAAAHTRSPILFGNDESEFKSKYDRTPFLIHHTLHQSGLFEIPRIARLGKKILEGKPENFGALNFKTAAIDSKFTAMPPDAKLAETIERIEEGGSWIKLTRAQELDPEYSEVLDTIISEIESITQVPLREEITWATMTLFLASPKITTPFHIDHESNILFQVQGEKDVCLFDPSDRELVTDAEVERFYNGNSEAALYRSNLQDRGTVFRLVPGKAVHHPPLAPHWVKNADNTSVSVSIGFCMKSLEKRARVYQANYLLRQLGLSPSQPGRSPAVDSIKSRVLSSLEMSDPKSYYEVVFSPMTRLKKPLNALRSVAGRR